MGLEGKAESGEMFPLLKKMWIFDGEVSKIKHFEVFCISSLETLPKANKKRIKIAEVNRKYSEQTEVKVGKHQGAA